MVSQMELPLPSPRLAWLVKAGTMKRKLKWMAVALVILLVGFGTALFLLPRDRITYGSVQKIQFGMTETEVEGIFGGPGMNSDDERFAAMKDERGMNNMRLFLDWRMGEWWGTESKVWQGQSAIIGVYFDRKGHVSGMRFCGRSSYLDRIRDWLGW
jgi:hypothetical protein